MKDKVLAEIREKLKEHDRELLRLLNARASLSEEIGKIKRSCGIEVYDPSLQIFSQIGTISLKYGRVNDPQGTNLGTFNETTPDGTLTDYVGRWDDRGPCR